VHSWERYTAEALDPAGLVESERSYGSLYVNVSINGTGPIRMLLDTGAYINSVSSETADRIGLVPRGTWDIRDFNGQAVRSSRAAVDEMIVGGLTLRDFEVWINPAREEHGDQGVLGMIGIQDHTLAMNFETGQVELSDERLNPDDPGVIEFRLSEDYKAKIPVLIEKPSGAFERVWATLDTGFRGTLTLGRRESRAHRLEDRLVFRTRMYGTHGPSSSWAAEKHLLAGDLKIGGITYSRIVAATDQPGTNAGAALFEGCLVTIDWPSSLLKIERVDGASRMLDLASYGILPIDDGSGRLTIIAASTQPDPDGMALDYSKSIESVNGLEPDGRFQHRKLWPIGTDAREVVIKYRDPDTGATGEHRLPIDKSPAPR